MKINSSLAFTASLLVAGVVSPLVSFADQGRFERGYTHSGEMDTDGILSPGEIRNPRIDYNRAQRDYERHGDYRVENPYNDDAAYDSKHARYYRDRDERWDRDHYRYRNGRSGNWLDRNADSPWPW